jgi:hypothetical protein
MKRVALFALLSLAICLPSFSQVKADQDRVEYAPRIDINFKPFTGIVLSFQDEVSKISWGIKPEFSKLLKQSEESKIYYDKYKAKNSLGNILEWGGFGTIIAADLYMFSVVDENYMFTSDEQAYTTLGMCGVGLTIEIIGAILVQGSFRDILKAVNRYNYSLRD